MTSDGRQDRGAGGASYLTRRLPELLDVLSGTDVRELEIQDGDLRVRLRRRTVAVSPATSVNPALDEDTATHQPSLHEVRSPLVGTFYRTARAGDPPHVFEGARVTEDTIVGIVEALQIPTEVESGVTGTVSAILAADGQPVEYGQPLIEIVPDV